METKWTFFISSTLMDLRAERQAVANQVLKMEEIPIGMEQFGAIDRSSWDNIERFIDTADYYILIIAGKYGSIDGSPEGISYTEREYRYAKSKNIPVIALLHEDPDSLPARMSEDLPEKKIKLNAFRTEVKSARMVAFYTNTAELIGEVAAAIGKAKQRFPRPGWVRNGSIPTSTKLEIDRLQTELSQRNAELQRMAALQPGSRLDDDEVGNTSLYTNAHIRFTYTVEVRYSYLLDKKFSTVKDPMTWEEVFVKVARAMFDSSALYLNIYDALVPVLTNEISESEGGEVQSFVIDDRFAENMEFVFESLRVVKKDTMFGWSLTKFGRKLYVDWRAKQVFSADPPERPDWKELI